MKLAVVYFTYNNEYNMFKLSIDFLRLLTQKDVIDVYIVDDKLNPIKNFSIENTTYIQSGFSRNGNLNGIECINGMIEIYNNIMFNNSYDWVIKSDADTIINDLEWLRDIDTTNICQSGPMNMWRKIKHNNPLICHGAFHCFSRNGIKNINDNLCNITDYINMFPQEKERIPEDFFTSLMACNLDKNLNVYLENTYNNPIYSKDDKGLYFDFRINGFYQHFMKNIPVKFLEQYCGVTFKQFNNKCNDSILKRMTQFLIFKKRKI